MPHKSMRSLVEHYYRVKMQNAYVSLVDSEAAGYTTNRRAYAAFSFFSLRQTTLLGLLMSQRQTFHSCNAAIIAASKRRCFTSTICFSAKIVKSISSE